MSKTVTSVDDPRGGYRNKLEQAGRSLDNARMAMKHERRLLKMRLNGVPIK